jgi:hypothetical protein
VTSRWTIRRAAGALVALAAGAPLAAALAAPAADAPVIARVHRLHLPPAPAPVLATGLAVDEGEWYVRGSQIVVAAGSVHLRIYNRGQDDHDLTFVDADDQPHSVYLKPGADATLDVTLRPGTYKLFCSLFAGTKDSHEDLGMHTTLTAR